MRIFSTWLAIFAWGYFLPDVFAGEPVVANSSLATLRVTSWDLQPDFTVGRFGWTEQYQKNLRQEAVETLHQLQPDLILLQGMRDWEACQQLVSELKPASYNLVACSAFPHSDFQQSNAPGQVAILAKSKSGISWSEPWKANDGFPTAPGGYAFATVRVDGKNLGLFSLDLGNTWPARKPGLTNAISAREDAARQLVQQIGTVQAWKNNRPQVFVVAGNFDTDLWEPAPHGEKTLFRLQQFGFADVLTNLPMAARSTLSGSETSSGMAVDHLFMRDATLVGLPQISAVTLMAHRPITAQLYLDVPPTAPVVALVNSESSTPTNAPAPIEAQVHRSSSRVVFAANNQPTVWFWLWAAATAGLVLLLILISNRHSRTARPIRGSTTLVVARPADDSLRHGLAQWLKTSLMERLIGDRRRLLAAQQEASRKMLAVDQRLANIEEKIQQRNREYEDRIDELVKELETTREDNHELIKEKIAAIKAELEKERLKAILLRNRRN